MPNSTWNRPVTPMERTVNSTVMPKVNGSMPNRPCSTVAPSTVPPTTTTSSAARMGVNGMDRRTIRSAPIQAVSSTHSVDTCS